MEDLSRMFRLFSKIPKGLDPVSNIFKQVGSLRFILFSIRFVLGFKGYYLLE